jgi:hypothetical protein
MTTFGKNMKLTANRELRDRLHEVLVEGLGLKSVLVEDAFSVYRLDDDFNLGVYFVPADEALSEQQQTKAPWLELVVDDVEKRHRALARLSVEAVPYPRDPDHAYLRLPGGPVFRLTEG